VLAAGVCYTSRIAFCKERRGVRAITEDEVRERLRAAIATVGSQREWARQAGVSESLVSEVLKGTRGFGPQILKALGLERAIVYGREGRSGPEA